MLHTAGYGGRGGKVMHNLILGIRTVFVQSVFSAAMQCPCKLLIVICCRHWKTKESNMYFPCFPFEAALSIFNIRCLLKGIFRMMR